MPNQHCSDGSPWTEERVTVLRRLWSDGVRGGAIAKQLGASRSAVMGKVRRLGLEARGVVGPPKSRKWANGSAAPLRIRTTQQVRKAPPKPKVHVRSDDPATLAAEALLGAARNAEQRRSAWRQTGWGRAL